MKVRTLNVLLFTLIFVACAFGGIADEFDWPRWRGPNGDGVSLETDWNPEALTGGPKILWRVNVKQGYSNDVIKENRLFTMGYKMREKEDIVFCLNAETGEEIWRYVYPGGDREPQTTPTIDGKYVYTLSVDGKVFCFKAKNGKVRWNTNTIEEHGAKTPFWGYAGSPIIDDNLLLMTANTTGIALDKNTGEMVWTSSVPTEINLKNEDTGVDYSTPVLYDYGGKRHVLFLRRKALHSVEVETGKKVWSYDLEHRTFIGTDPLFASNTILITRGHSVSESMLLDISDNNPTVLWKLKNIGSAMSSPVIYDGFIYLSDGDYEGYNQLRCIDWETGQTMWEQKIRSSSLTIANGKIIVLDEKGTLSIVEANPSAYDEISSIKIPDQRRVDIWWTPPVLCNGKIYCRSFMGDLVCIDVSK